MHAYKGSKPVRKSFHEAFIWVRMAYSSTHAKSTPIDLVEEVWPFEILLALFQVPWHWYPWAVLAWMESFWFGDISMF